MFSRGFGKYGAAQAKSNQHGAEKSSSAKHGLEYTIEDSESMLDKLSSVDLEKAADSDSDNFLENLPNSTSFIILS